MPGPGSVAPDEPIFRRWYSAVAKSHGLDPDPDSPLHFYDWRAAFRSGAVADSVGHWPSAFKLLGHPNLIVDGRDTRSGYLATPQLVMENARRNRQVTQQYRRK